MMKILSDSNLRRVVAVTIITLLLLVAVSHIFNYYNIDLRVQRFFYSDYDGWYLADAPLFSFLYHYGNIPAIIIVLIAVGGLIISFYKQRFIVYRRIYIFLILSMLIGPGIIVNSILKDHWGRPRPRQITEFGGRIEYRSLGELGVSGQGKSFPCGHATVGFYFFVLYFVMKRNKGGWAKFFLLFALFYGSLIGLARIAQGGHFAGDVVWAGGIVFLVCYILYHCLSRLKKQEVLSHKKVNKPLLISLLVLIPIVVLLFLAATPYYTYRDTYLPDDREKIFITIEDGFVFVNRGTENILSVESHGFGFPGGKVRINQQDDVFTIKQKGYFTELNNNVLLNLADFNQIELQIEKGELVFDEVAVNSFSIIRDGKITLISNK